MNINNNSEAEGNNLPSNQLHQQRQQEQHDESDAEPPFRSKLPLPPSKDNTYNQKEWTNTSILTQYIGPPATAASNNTLAVSNVNTVDNPEQELKSELRGVVEGIPQPDS